MARQTVVIQDHVSAKKTTVEIPDDVPMSRLLPVLVTRMSLPSEHDGQPIQYQLDHRASGRRLDSEDTLASAQIGDAEVLTLLPEVIAGVELGPSRRQRVRGRRLQSDLERLTRLASESDLVEIIDTNGDPPEAYQIRLRCTSIIDLDNGVPVLGDRHELEIYLPIEYPVMEPYVRVTTPLFHPNINPEGTAVCMNSWYPSKFLDDLVVMLVRMLQFNNVNPHDPLRDDAALWLLENEDSIPVDSTPIWSNSEREFDGETEVVIKDVEDERGGQPAERI